MVERFLAVGPDRGDIARARHWARTQVERFAWPMRWRPDVDAVTLVVSELVTNALRYAGGVAGLSLVFGVRRLRIVVSDDSRRPPVPQHPGGGAVGGHGLGIVGAVADTWGVVRTANGKQVWAEVGAADTRGGTDGPQRAAHSPDSPDSLGPLDSEHSAPSTYPVNSLGPVNPANPVSPVNAREAISGPMGPNGRGLGQVCLSCPSVLPVKSRWAPSASVRWLRRWASMLAAGAARRTLPSWPSCSGAAVRASRRMVGKAGSARALPVRSGTRFGW